MHFSNLVPASLTWKWLFSFDMIAAIILAIRDAGSQALVWGWNVPIFLEGEKKQKKCVWRK